MTTTIDLLETLLGASLSAWRVPGDVSRAPDGALVVNVRHTEIRVSRAAAGVPFRWMVETGERSRGTTSVAGVLRAVRAAVDPDHQPVRLRIAPLPPQ